MNEYHGRDYAGGGATYITSDFGPRGEEARAQQIGMSVAKYRKMHKDSEAAARRNRTRGFARSSRIGMGY